MTPRRLRPSWSTDELAHIYPTPHDHRIYGRGHAERVDAMRYLVAELTGWGGISTVADLSCGNASVTAAAVGVDRVYLGDYALGHELVGPIEQTLDQIPNVDLFISGETLEHLDDPFTVMNRIGKKTRYLVLSTPIDNWNDTNAQHYWAWSQTDVELMLTDAGFTVEGFISVDSRLWGEPYHYGIWCCVVEEMVRDRSTSGAGPR